MRACRLQLALEAPQALPWVMQPGGLVLADRTLLPGGTLQSSESSGLAVDMGRPSAAALLSPGVAVSLSLCSVC